MIPDEARRALGDLSSVADELGVSLLLVGAGARILIFDQRYGIEGRSTTDWDLAVRVDRWETFHALVSRMTEGPDAFFRKTRVFHRFEHGATDLTIDIVPFGDIAHPDHAVKWPDGGEKVMNVIGFEDAYQNAEVVSEGGLSLRVVNIPSFIVLKLIAWDDRGGSKDLQDIVLILRHLLEDVEVIAQVYGDEELSKQLMDETLEFEKAGSVYVGREIKRLFSENAAGEVIRILENITNNSDKVVTPLVESQLDGSDWDSKFDSIYSCFMALLGGIRFR